MTCPHCKGTGFITLLTSRKPCECRTVNAMQFDMPVNGTYSLEAMESVPRGDGVFDCSFTYTWTSPDEAVGE